MAVSISLKSLEQSLRLHLANDAMFTLVNTRLMLRTGVDLKSIDPVQERKPELVAEVIEALKKMGYPLEKLGHRP